MADNEASASKKKTCHARKYDECLDLMDAGYYEEASEVAIRNLRSINLPVYYQILNCCAVVQAEKLRWTENKERAETYWLIAETLWAAANQEAPDDDKNARDLRFLRKEVDEARWYMRRELDQQDRLDELEDQKISDEDYEDVKRLRKRIARHKKRRGLEMDVDAEAAGKSEKDSEESEDSEVESEDESEAESEELESEGEEDSVKQGAKGSEEAVEGDEGKDGGSHPDQDDFCPTPVHLHGKWCCAICKWLDIATDVVRLR